jgi:hypothetical protein
VGFWCGRDRLVAGAGGHVLIPRGTPHAFGILAPAVRMIVTASSADERPVGLDRYLPAMSGPATSLDLPAAGTAMAYAASADLAHATRPAAEHGIRVSAPTKRASSCPATPASAPRSGEGRCGHGSRARRRGAARRVPASDAATRAHRPTRAAPGRDPGGR